MRTFFRPLFKSDFSNRFEMAKSSILIVLYTGTIAFFLIGTLGLSNALTCIAFLLPADSTGRTVWTTLGIERLFILSDFFSFGIKPRSYCAIDCNFSSSCTIKSSSWRKREESFYIISCYFSIFLIPINISFLASLFKDVCCWWRENYVICPLHRLTHPVFIDHAARSHCKIINNFDTG